MVIIGVVYYEVKLSSSRKPRRKTQPDHFVTFTTPLNEKTISAARLCCFLLRYAIHF